MLKTSITDNKCCGLLVHRGIDTPNIMRAAPVAVAVLLFSCPTLAAGPDYIRKEEPVVDTIEDAEGLLEGFEEKEFEESTFPEIEEALDELPPFWRDTSLALKPRSYYFDRDRDTGDSVAWALGGAIEYQSGSWKDRFQVGATVFTSQKLYGPGDKDGTLLLKPGQRGFTVLGEAYADLVLTDGLKFRGGRTALNLPYINREDNRMVPNTFLAYGLEFEPFESLELLGTHVTHMKVRNADDFDPMSKAAGLNGTNEPATVGSVRYEWDEGNNLGLVNLYSWELFNTLYAAVNLSQSISDDLDVGLSAQFTDQRSVGDELAGDFETWVFTARLNVTWRGLTPSFAFSTTDDASGIRSPYGSYPGYLSLMVEDFNRAGEDAWLVGLAYDFSYAGMPWLSAFANYADGDASELPDQSELNMTMDFRPTARGWDNLWLSVRYADVDKDAEIADDLRDWRVILNYEVPLLDGGS